MCVYIYRCRVCTCLMTPRVVNFCIAVIDTKRDNTGLYCRGKYNEGDFVRVANNLKYKNMPMRDKKEITILLKYIA